MSFDDKMIRDYKDYFESIYLVKQKTNLQKYAKEYLKGQDTLLSEASQSPKKAVTSTKDNTILDWGDLFAGDDDLEVSTSTVQNYNQRAVELMHIELHGYLDGVNKTRPAFQDKQ